MNSFHFLRFRTPVPQTRKIKIKHKTKTNKEPPETVLMRIRKESHKKRLRYFLPYEQFFNKPLQ